MSKDPHDRRGRNERAGRKQKRRRCRLAVVATRAPGGRPCSKQVRHVRGVDGGLALRGTGLLCVLYAAARQDFLAAEEHLRCQRLRSPNLTATTSGERKGGARGRKARGGRGGTGIGCYFDCS